MAQIFISHSSTNCAEAIALRDWLISNGWNDIFLDLDPNRGLRPGQRWQAALKAAAEHCESVICLITPAWCSSKWCLTEFLLAKNLNKLIFGVIVEPTPFADLPTEMTAEWQLVDLTAGVRDHETLVNLPPSDNTVKINFGNDGLNRLRSGLQQAGLDPKYFDWPPANDPSRPPYRGFGHFEIEDAGIFFGREAPIVLALDKLRGLRNAGPPRVMVILGASGAGKSSFLQAGLFPRLKRQDIFLPLPVIRPERAVLYGRMGLMQTLENACGAAKVAIARADLRDAIQGGAVTLKVLLEKLAANSMHVVTGEEDTGVKPTIILSIDQSEELFAPEGRKETDLFLTLVRDLISTDSPAIIVIFTIRSDNYENLQVTKELEGIRQETFSLPPMPRGSFSELIKGPAKRLEGTDRKLKIDDSVVDAMCTDIEIGGGRDALPLLAFTLGRLYSEYGAGGHLKLEHYERLGGVKGSIEAAVDEAFRKADADLKVPHERLARLALLRRGLIPWLAGIDPDTGVPRRRVARISEIPQESRPLMNLLVEQRLLSTDISKETGETTIEPVHEALLRQWGLLQGWLAEDAGILGIMESVKRASRDWAANNKAADWLIHRRERLQTAQRLLSRKDLIANLESTDLEYLATCKKEDRKAGASRVRTRVFIGLLSAFIIAGILGWMNRTYVEKELYRIVNFRPYVLKAEALSALRPSDTFRECARNCPEMVVLSAGQFMMGSNPDEPGRGHDEGPEHNVIIPENFAISKFEITFNDWDACVQHGGCANFARDHGWGRDNRPVIYISWYDAKSYVRWLSEQTGARYRLLTEAEWEYAARAGKSGAFDLSGLSGKGTANCNGCGSKWDGTKTAPAGSFTPNNYGLYDMQGNVWEWVEDCWIDGYSNAPRDGTAIDVSDCQRRVLRGGAWNYRLEGTRPAFRYAYPPVVRNFGVGLRVARTFTP